VPSANNSSSIVKRIAYCLKWFKETLNTCPQSILLNEDNLESDKDDRGQIFIASPGIYSVQLILFLAVSDASMKPSLEVKLDDLTIFKSCESESQ
jgi:hypothetical protein